MRHALFAIFIFFANLVGISCALADTEILPDKAVGAGLFLSHDNEGFNTQRVALEYLPRYENADSRTGMRHTTHRYQQGGWSRNGQQLTLLHRNNDLATAHGWQLDAGLFIQGGYNLLTLDGGARHALAEHTGLELFINRDWVETAKALDNGVHFTLAGISLEQSLSTHVTLVGLGAWQKFSDGNARNHGRLKLILQPYLERGLTLQARYRAYNSSHDNVAGMYFNPGEYKESMLVLGWRKKMPGWNVSLTAGAGQQKIDDGPSTATRLLEGNLQNSPARPYSIRMRAGRSQSAAFNGPNYRYNYFISEWVRPF